VGCPIFKKTDIIFKKNPTLKFPNDHQTILCFQKYLVKGKSSLSEEASGAETAQAQ